MSRILGRLDTDSRRLYVGFLVGFALFGVTMTLVGATLPRLIREHAWSYTSSGAVLASGSVGYFLTTFVVGFLIHRLGFKPVMVVGLAIETAGLVLFGRSPSPAVNMLLYFAVGVGQGCVEIVTNFGVIRMEKQGESRLMNLVHAAFCVGGVVGPFATGAYLRLTEASLTQWRLVYPAAGLLVALGAVMFARLRFPSEPSGGAEPDTRRGAAAPAGRYLAPLLGLFFVMVLLYVSAEIGFSNWTSEYFVVVLGTDAAVGALMVSILWLGILAGRLGLSLWYAGDRQDLAILGLSLLSTLSLLLLRLARPVPLAALAVFSIGLGFSGVYPMVMTLVGRWFGSGRAVGIVSTGGGIGSFAFPFLMGYLGELTGIGSAILLCAVASGSLAAVSLGALVLRPRPSRVACPPGRGEAP